MLVKLFDAMERFELLVWDRRFFADFMNEGVVKKYDSSSIRDVEAIENFGFVCFVLSAVDWLAVKKRVEAREEVFRGRWWSVFLQALLIRNCASILYT